MSARDRGFASLSKARKRDISTRGGKAVQAAGTGHVWDKAESEAAAAKSVAQRKRTQAARAAVRLMSEFGFEPEALAKLNLSMDEYLWYGGSKSTEQRINELKGRAAAVTGVYLPLTPVKV